MNDTNVGEDDFEAPENLVTDGGDGIAGESTTKNEDFDDFEEKNGSIEFNDNFVDEKIQIVDDFEDQDETNNDDKQGNGSVLITEVKKAKNENKNQKQGKSENKTIGTQKNKGKIENSNKKVINYPKFKPKPKAKPLPESINANEPPKRPPLFRPSQIPEEMKNKKQQQGGSIINFNPNFEPNFTEVATKEAIRNLGIIVSELRYPSEMKLNNYSRDPKIREMAREKMVANVDNMIQEIKNERERILQAKKNASTENIYITDDPEQNSKYLENERKRIEKLKELQKTEVEQLLVQILKMQKNSEDQEIRNAMEAEKEKEKTIMERKKMEEQEKKKKEILQKKLLQEQEREKREEELRRQNEEKEAIIQARTREDAEKRRKEAEEEARIRKERNEANRRKLEELFTKRAAEIEQQKEMEEAREAERLRKEMEERKHIADLRNQYAAAQQAHLMKIKEEKEKEAQHVLQQAQEKDLRVQENIKISEGKKMQQIEERSRAWQRKYEIIMESKQRIEEENQKKLQELIERNDMATMRYNKMEEDKRHKSMVAATGYDEASRKVHEKLKNINQQLKEKAREKQIQLEKAEERIAYLREQRLETMHANSVINRIKMEQRSLEVARSAMKKEIKSEKYREELEMKMHRIEMAQASRDKMREMSNKQKIEMEHERVRLKEEMAKLKPVSSSSNRKILEDFAEMYGIDLSSLEKKVNGTRIHTSSLPKLKTSSSTYPHSESR